MPGDTKALIEKIEALPAERIAEIEDFVEFIRLREEDRTLTRAASAPSFRRGWDNPEDDADKESPVFSAYPAYIYVLSVFVLIGTLFSLCAGYAFPGPVTSAAFPIFLTLWWLLYRSIRRQDNQRTAYGAANSPPNSNPRSMTMRLGSAWPRSS